MDDIIYLYSVVLTTKAKDRRLRRSAKEKLSYTTRRNVLTCVLPPVYKTFSFLANGNCSAMRHRMLNISQKEILTSMNTLVNNTKTTESK